MFSTLGTSLSRAQKDWPENFSQKIHIEGLSQGHGWEDFSKYETEYEHPVWTSTKEKAKGAGHGGMDFIENYRLINALRKGVSPDIDVYVSVSWIAIIPLGIFKYELCRSVSSKKRNSE